MNRLLSLQILILIIFVSTAKAGDTCQIDSDCPALHACTDNICYRTALFPLSAKEIIGTFIILFMSSSLTIGGVGGGAAYVPYIMLLFEVDLHKAITYAYACAFGGGLGNLSNTIFLKNPKNKRFLINYDINLIILPALMAGVLLGSILQRILAPLVVNILLLLVLAYSISKNALKVKTILKKEKQERKFVEMSKLSIPSPQPHSPEADQLNDQELAPVKSKDFDAQRHKIEQQMLKYPFHKLALLAINIVIIIVMGIIRGSSKFDPVVGVDWTCGWDFLWFGISVAIFGIASAVNIYLVTKWQKEKIRVGYEFLPEEPLLNTKRIISIMTASFIGGCIGSIVALGGGLVYSPTLNDMGIPPAFTASSAGLMLVFSMFNTIFQQIMNKKVTGLEIAWFVPLAIMCSFISSKIVNYYVRKTGRQSIILMLMLLITVSGFGCVVYNLINGMVENSKQQTTFGSVC